MKIQQLYFAVRRDLHVRWFQIAVNDAFLMRPFQPTGGFSGRTAQRILTFNAFCLTLLFFRAPPLRAAVEMLLGLSNFAWRSEYAAAFAMLCVFAVPLPIVPQKA